MSFEEKEMEYLQGIFDAYEANPNECNDWEKGFMSDNQRRFQEYGAEMHLSEKQWAIIRKVGIIYSVHEPGSEAAELQSYDKKVKAAEKDEPEDEIPF